MGYTYNPFTDNLDVIADTFWSKTGSVISPTEVGDSIETEAQISAQNINLLSYIYFNA